MHLGKKKFEHIDEFHKLVSDLAAIDTVISDEGYALLLLTSLPLSYRNLKETLLYCRDTLKLEDVMATLNFRELQKIIEAKGDGGEGLYMRAFKEELSRHNQKKSQDFVRNKDQVSGSGVDGYDSADVMMVMSVEQLLNSIMDSKGSYHKTYNIYYLFDFEEYDGGNVLLGDGMECRVQRTLDTTRSTYLVNRSPSSAIRFKKPIDMLDFFSWLTSIKQGMLEPVKVKRIFLGYREVIVNTTLWRLDDITSKGVEFEVEPQKDHTFEVELHGNVDQANGLQKYKLKGYHSARDREQHIYLDEGGPWSDVPALVGIAEYIATCEEFQRNEIMEFIERVFSS
ncbi:hypothetical protein Tco_1273742 [Tanacetum coccineum]